jgi:hypothetical protein
MSGKKRPHSFSVDLESVRSLAECPVCFDIPVDGVMLMCANGHNLCAACKTKLGKDAKCPQGGCDYHTPPILNRTVADLVEHLPFELPCKHAKAGCVFVGTKGMLGPHEKACQRRPVPCLVDACTKLFAAEDIIEHLKTAHEAAVDDCAEGPDAFNVEMLWKNSNNLCAGQFSWRKGVHETYAGRVISCAKYVEGQVFLWLVAVAPKSEADKYKCQVSLSNGDNSMNFSAPLFPIGWTEEQILKDERCVCLSNYSVRQMLCDNTTDEKKNGFLSKFKATFRIVEITA